MALTFQRARTWLARQKTRLRTMLRALFPGHEEEQYRVIRGVVTRLPLAEATKTSILDWSLNRILDRRKRTARTQILQAQSEWNAKGTKRLQQLFAEDTTLKIPSTSSPIVSFIIVTYNKAHLTLLTLESVLQFSE